MSKSMLVGAVLGAVSVAADDVVATYSPVDRGPDYAEVVAVQPAKETIRTPYQVCKDVVATRQCPVKDQHQIAGTAIGAVVGGLSDNQTNGSIGKKVVIVAGIVGNDHTDNKVQEGMQERDTYTTTEARCSIVCDSSEEIVGHSVKYVLDDKAGQVRMEYNPGSQIPVDRNGRLILSRGGTLR